MSYKIVLKDGKEFVFEGDELKGAIQKGYLYVYKPTESSQVGEIVFMCPENELKYHIDLSHLKQSDEEKVNLKGVSVNFEKESKEDLTKKQSDKEGSK